MPLRTSAPPSSVADLIAALAGLGVRLREGYTAADVVAAEGGERWAYASGNPYLNVLGALSDEAPDGGRFSHDVVGYDYEINGMWDFYAEYLRETAALAGVEVRDAAVEFEQEARGSLRTVRLSFTLGGERHAWTMEQHGVDAAGGFLPRVAWLLSEVAPTRSLVECDGCLMLLTDAQARAFEDVTGLRCRQIEPHVGDAA